MFAKKTITTRFELSWTLIAIGVVTMQATIIGKAIVAVLAAGG